MHQALQDFFDTHAASTTQHTRAVHDQLMPIATVVDGVIAHINELESKLTAAELAAHDHALDSKFEWMHTRLRSAHEKGRAVRIAIRDLAKVLVEIETGFGQDLINIQQVLARRATTADSSPS